MSTGAHGNWKRGSGRRGKWPATSGRVVITVGARVSLPTKRTSIRDVLVSMTSSMTVAVIVILISSLCYCCSICGAVNADDRVISAVGGSQQQQRDSRFGVFSPSRPVVIPANTGDGGGDFPARNGHGGGKFPANTGDGGGDFPARNAHGGGKFASRNGGENLAGDGITISQREFGGGLVGGGGDSRHRSGGAGSRSLLEAPPADPEMGFMAVIPNQPLSVQSVSSDIPKRYYFKLNESSAYILTIEVRNSQGGCGLYVFDPTGSSPDTHGGFVGPGREFYTWKSDVPGSNVEMIYVKANETINGVYTISLIGRAEVQNLCELSVLSAPVKTEVNALQKDTIATFFKTCCPSLEHGVSGCTEVVAAGGAEFVNACHLPGFSCTPDGNITRMVMNAQNLTCEFPSAVIAKLDSLKWIELRNNSIFGTVDWALLGKNLPQLSHLDLAYNRIEGVISCDLQKHHLEHLDLGHNEFEGPLPICLAGVSGLGVFNVAHNRLNGSILDANGTTQVASSLRRFVISSNRVKGSLTLTWGTLKNLLVLRVNDNQLTGHIPGNLFQPALLELDITNNMFEGVLPGNLSLAQKLQVLSLGHNPLLKGNLPPNITRLPLLSSLSFENTSISGELPTEWNTARLSQVVGYRAKLTGLLPSSLIGLPALRHVELQENEMYGDLPLFPPQPLTRFNGILFLNLSHNNFSGAFPVSWSELAMFDSQRNPFDLGETIQEYVLDVSFNMFSGPIPKFLYPEAVPSWTSVFLQGNDLTCQQVVYDSDSKFVGGVPCAEGAAGSSGFHIFPRSNLKLALIVGLSTAAVVVLSAVVAAVFFLKRRRRRPGLRGYGRFSNM